MAKKIILGLLGVLVVIQFIRPQKNVSEGIAPEDISNVYAVPAPVQDILKNKCYDCHSNHTVYPWYSNVQPIGWWLAFHVNEGKEHLDFSIFKNYSSKDATHKLEELSEVVTEKEMPLSSYLWLHPDAEITPADQEAINTWLKSLSIKVEGEEEEGDGHGEHEGH